MWATVEQASWVAAIVALITSVFFYRASNRATLAQQRRIELLLRVIAQNTGDQATIDAMLAEAADSEKAASQWRLQATRWARATLGALIAPVLIGAYVASALMFATTEVHGFEPTTGAKPIVEHVRCTGWLDCSRRRATSFIWHTDTTVRTIEAELTADRREDFHTFTATVLVKPHDNCKAGFRWTISVAGTPAASGEGDAKIDTPVKTTTASIQLSASRLDTNPCEADLVLQRPVLDHDTF
ncbi:hypothetical protein AB0M02_18340 [Actinoplanes sp. NPDC051861]|uniref:hypothetical protein n=1 Tax=Actinoplanes sp. NPDC051861 TaxID=3155170 RepID=UPI0034344F9C